MNHHSERVWSLGVGRGAVCVWVVGLGGRWYVVLQWLCVESAEEERDLESDEKRNGKDRRRGSGHRSLSQLTQPSGVALSFSLFSSASLTPSAPHTHTPTQPPHPCFSHPHSFLLPSSVETEGERSVGELTMAVHFTVGLRTLREIEAGGGGGRKLVASEKLNSDCKNISSVLY